MRAAAAAAAAGRMAASMLLVGDLNSQHLGAELLPLPVR